MSDIRQLNEHLYHALTEAAKKENATIESVKWTIDNSDVFKVHVVVAFHTGTKVRVGYAFTRMDVVTVAEKMRHALVGEIEKAGRHFREQIEPRFIAAAQPRAADSTTPALGFRRWKVVGGEVGSEVRLSSSEVDFPQAATWDAGRWVLATCARGHHAAPDGDCHCGFNAYHEFEALAAKGAIRPTIPGAMIGKGRLQVHPLTGFRAEWAKPVALTWFYYGNREWVRKVGAALGIPVVDPDDLVSFAKEYGEPLPSEALTLPD